MTSSHSRDDRLTWVPADPPFRTLAEWAEYFKRHPKTLRARMRDPIPFPRPVQVFGKTHGVILASDVDAWCQRKYEAGQRDQVGRGAFNG